MNLQFQIKICGITCVEDLQSAVDAGADAIGLNFYRGSKRYVTLDQAAAIVAACPPGVAKIGVFVNALRAEVADAMARASLDAIQFHGDEPPRFLALFTTIPSMRAFRWSGEGKAIDDYLARCAECGRLPARLLIDSHVAGAYGGTGATADWSGIASWMRGQRGESSPVRPPIVLAGGLNPTNVAAAIRATKPVAVDTASGVESSPGRKDARLMRQFVEVARRAFAEVQAPPNR